MGFEASVSMTAKEESLLKETDVMPGPGAFVRV